MSQPHSASSIGRNAFWSVSNQLTGQVLSLVVFLITARFVSKEDFGIMATAMLAVELFRQFLLESIGTVIYSRKSPDNDDYTAAFYMIAACGLISSGIVFFLAYPIADLMNHANLAPTLQWVAAILLTMGLSKTHEIWLTKNLQFKKLALRSMGSILIGGGIGIWMAMHGYGLLSLITQQIVTALISLAWLWTSCKWRPGLRVKWDKMVSIFHYWKYLALNSLTAIFNGQSDIFLSSYYLGPAATGVYNAAKRMIAAASMVVNGGFNSVALPAMASYSHERELFRNSYITCAKATTFLTAPLYAGLAALSADLILILMGPKWEEVSPILSILAISAFLGSLSAYSVNVILIDKKAHWQTILGITGALTNVILLFTFARYGLTVLAWAFITRVVIFTPITTYLALKILDLPIKAYLGQVSLPITFSLVMAAVIYWGLAITDWSPLINLLIYIPLGGACYLLLFFIFDRKTLHQGLHLLKTVTQRPEKV